MKAWPEVEQSQQYQLLPDNEKQDAKQQYFDNVVRAKPEFKNLSGEEQSAASGQFFRGNDVVQADSISKNMRQGMNPVKATWTQMAQHPFKTTFQGIPKTIAGVDSGEAFIDRSPRTPFTPEQKEAYKNKWGEYPSKENELGLSDRFKATALQAIDMGSAPGNLFINPAFKAVGKVANKIPAVGNKIADMALSPEFAQDAADFKYGHDARRVMKTMPDIFGSDAHSTKAAILNKTQETGKAIGDTIANSPKSMKAVGITDKDIVSHIDEKIAELNKADPKGNLRTIRALESKKVSLLNNFDEKGNLLGPIDFKEMTPQQLFDYKESKLGNIKYTGRQGVDESALNSALQESRANIVRKMNIHLPELKPLNQDYGDLKSAQDAIDRVIFKGQKEGLSGLGIKNILTAGLNNPINRIRLARWLYTTPKAEVAQAVKTIPGLQKAVDNLAGSEAGSVGELYKQPIVTNRPAPANMADLGRFEGEGGAITQPTAKPTQPVLNNPAANFNPIKAQGAGEFNHAHDYNKGLAEKMMGGGLSAAVVAPKVKTIGDKNNNPINLKAFDKWDGMTGKDSFGHAQFKDLDSGIRASLKNLKNHQAKNPTQSVEAYMKTFAEKNGDKEAAFIAQKLGVSPKTSIGNVDMDKFLIHLAKFESKLDITPEQIKKVKDKFKIK